MASADLIFDTIDFIDLASIIALHDECKKQGKPIISALNIGFGAGALYFPANHDWTLRRLLGLPKEGVINNEMYGSKYKQLLQKLASTLEPEVQSMLANVFNLMEQGKPCPASQTAVGTATVAAIAGTIAARIAQGLQVTAAPEMIIVKMHELVSAPGINVAL